MFKIFNKYQHVNDISVIMSLTFTLTGTESILNADYSPPLDVSNGSWVIGLVDFQCYNSIPNIVEGKNKLYYYDKNKLEHISIPVGSYEIEDLCDYIRSLTGDPNYHEPHRNGKVKFEFLLRPNVNTLKCEILCSRKIDFTQADSIGSLLGFTKRVLEPNKLHESDLPVNILKVNSIQIECNISSGSYRNNSLVHILHVFFPTAPPGYKIIEVPSNVIYLPVSVGLINNITVKVVDQQGDIINFRGETITVRLHLKQINGD